MKQIITLTIFLIVQFFTATNHLSGQITLSLGNDTTYCIPVQYNMDILLAPQIKVTNAQEPVEFTWECKYDFSENTTFYASEFLDDTASKFPTIKSWLTWPDWLNFKLTIIDNLGNMVNDSIKVRFSVFGYSLGFYQLYIHQGDSIQIGGEFVGGGIEPLTYLWTPSKWLDDSTLYSPWSKPDSSISYFQVAIDSIGCVSEPNKGFQIVVKPTGVENNNSDYKPFTLKGSILEFNDTQTDSGIIIYLVNGQIVASINQFIDRIDLSEFTQFSGLNIATFSIQGKYYYVKFLN